MSQANYQERGRGSSATCGAGVKGRALVAAVAALAFGTMCRSTAQADLPTVSPAATDAVAHAPTAPSPSPVARTPEAAKHAAAAKLGETVTFGDSKWIVLKAENLGPTAKSNNQFQPDLKSDGGMFVRVSFKVTNLGKTEERLLSQPKLKDSQGREFSELDNVVFFIPAGKHSLLMEAIPPSLPKEFWAVYEVPSDATGLQFMARELSMTGDTYPVDLALK